MSGEVSYFSRFFVKFIEIIAAGIASAVSAYLVAHYGGLLSSLTPSDPPVATAVQGPTASEVARSSRSQPTPPVTAATANERYPAPQQYGDPPVAQLTPKVGKDAKALPPRKLTKTDTSVAVKGPRGENSVEALARAALARDANRSDAAGALIRPGLTDTRSAAVDVLSRAGSVPQRQDDVWLEAPQPRPATGPYRSSNVRVDPLPPSAGRPPIAAPQLSPPADQDKGVFSVLQRVPDLLRPNPPPATSEAPRPPMPVGTASSETTDFGN